MGSVRRKIFGLCIVAIMIVAAVATVCTLRISNTPPTAGGEEIAT